MTKEKLKLIEAIELLQQYPTQIIIGTDVTQGVFMEPEDIADSLIQWNKHHERDN